MGFSVREFFRRTGSLVVVILITAVWYIVGATLLAVGISMAVLKDKKEVWGINVIIPGAGCLFLGLLTSVLLIYDCIRGQASKPRYAKRKKGQYRAPEYYQEGHEKI